MDRMSLPTSGTLLPAGGGIIHAMHGGGDGTIPTQSVSMLPAAGGMIHAMHGGSGSLLPIAGGTIHAMSGGDGGFMQTKAGNSMIPVVNAPIYARSGGFRGGQRIITHLGESYTLQNPPKERINATEPYDKDSDEYKILHSLGLEDLYKLDRDGMSGTEQEYDVLKSIYDGKCNLNSSLGSLAECEPIRRIIHTLALELKQSIAFSMNIFNEADRAATNAARALQNGAKDPLAKALNQPEEEEQSEAQVLREQEEEAQAALRAALEEKEKQAKQAKESASDEVQAKSEEEPHSEEDYARIAITSIMAHTILSEAEKEELRKKELYLHGLSTFDKSKDRESERGPTGDELLRNVNEAKKGQHGENQEDNARISMAAMIPSVQSEESSLDKPEDPFHIASIATIAAIHDPSSIPVPIATVEDEEDLTGENDARIAIAAMMALDSPPVSVDKVTSELVIPVLKPEEAVQVPPAVKKIVEPDRGYEERIGEIGTIIDENDPSTFQPEAYDLLKMDRQTSNPRLNERNALDLLFDRDETNPYYSSFLSKNSICARTFMASESLYGTAMKKSPPDHQFMADLPRTRNWKLYLPDDMLTAEEKMQFKHIRDDDKMQMYEKWIQPVLKDKLTPDERAIFICLHQGLESAPPFVYSEKKPYRFANSGGEITNNGYELFDKHTITLDENTFSYRFVKMLYKADEEKYINNPSDTDKELTLFSGTIHIDRINYKQANDKTFIQFELFDFHNPFVHALQIQKVKSVALAVKEYLQIPYSKKSRAVIHNSSPLKNVNTVNREKYQQNEDAYRKHLLSSLIDDKQVLDAEHLTTIQGYIDNIPNDVNELVKLLDSIIKSMTTRSKTIHDDFEKMVIQAYSITKPIWNQVVDNVYFDKGNPNTRQKQLEPTHSLSNKQDQYREQEKVVYTKLETVQAKYNHIISMDTLNQIIEKIDKFHLTDRYPIFGKLSEWYDKQNIAKNYESPERKSFHEQLLEVSKERFDTRCHFLDTTMSYQELVQLYLILTKNRDMIDDSSNPSNNESPPSSPPPSPPPSPKSSSRTIPNAEALLEKIENLPQDPSNEEFQRLASATEALIGHLDSDANELAQLEQAEAQSASTVSNIAISAIDGDAVDSSSEAASVEVPSESQALSAMEVDSSSPPANAANGLIKPNSTNKGRKRTPQYNAIVKELNGLRGKHPKFLKNQSLNNSLTDVQTQANTTQVKAPESLVIPPNANQRNKKPTPPESKKTFNQLFQNEMNKQEMIQKEERKRQKEEEKLLKEEMEHFGINKNSAPAPAPVPAVAPVAPAVVASNNLPSEPSEPSEPAKPNTKFKSLAQHAEEAGVKPYVEPPAPVPAAKSIASAPTVQTAPFKISKKLMNQQEAYQKQLNNDPAVQRARARIAAAKKEKQNNMERQRSEALAARKASEAKQAAQALQSTSSKPFNPSSLQNAPPISQKSSVDLRKKLKEKMKEKKAKTGHFGGTRKKTKQSRKKIQTRKRSTHSSKRSTSSK